MCEILASYRKDEGRESCQHAFPWLSPDWLAYWGNDQQQARAAYRQAYPWPLESPSRMRDMVGLRVLRANGDWESYWQAFPQHLNN